MEKLLKLIKIKNITPAVLIILIWQICFPQHVMALQINTNKNQLVANKFTEQWLMVNIADSSQEKASLRLPENADRPQPKARKTMRISVTAYSSTVDQCGSSPFTTASGTQVRDGVIAANFLPIGTKVRFPDYYGSKIFTVEDRMSNRYWYRADIWMASRDLAKQWGVRNIMIEII
ncbi:MAG: 3D domain-containing protein [Patescibacteria group bacterium]